jgi:ABC-type branched-subunit amino acid transport system substrate-binding protein
MEVRVAWTSRAGVVAACGVLLAIALARGSGILEHSNPGTGDVAPTDRRSGGEAPEPRAEDAGASERGRLIYRKGSGQSGRPITAVLQGSNAEVSASLITCAHCHGDDGHGRPEGGIEPPDLTWDVLTDPGGARRPAGRARPAYDRPSLVRAITMGIDAGGRTMGPGMPRYRLDQRDTADLISYLEVLGHDAIPGLTEGEIHLGTLLPPEAASPGLGRAVRQTLEARFDQINRDGGVYGRRLTLHAQQLPATPEEVGPVASAFLERVRPLALVACYISGLEGPLCRVIGEREIPTVGAFTPDPDESSPARHWIFYVQSGLDHQGAALARFAASRFAATGIRPAVVFIDDPRLSRAAAGVARAWAKDTGRDPALVPVGAGRIGDLVTRLRRSGHDLVFVLATPAVLDRFVVAAASADWYPYLFAPIALCGPDLLRTPDGFDRRVFVAFPQLASDRTVTGDERYRKLEQESGLGRDHLAVRLATLASIEVLLEVLARGGSRVDRAGLVSRLESLYGFESGFVSPLTFSPNDRVGSKGAHVLTIDLKERRLRPLGGWVSVRDAP